MKFNEHLRGLGATLILVLYGGVSALIVKFLIDLICR